ncbi:hypothetical protein CpipJ_CPIJ004676, partial [Culex quinquefasciatus]
CSNLAHATGNRSIVINGENSGEGQIRDLNAGNVSRHSVRCVCVCVSSRVNQFWVCTHR